LYRFQKHGVPGQDKIGKERKNMLVGLIMILIGAGFIALMCRIGNDDLGTLILGVVGVLLCIIGIVSFAEMSCDKIESRFADKDVLSDGSYYRVLSVTQDPSDPKTQYVIYVPKQGQVMDVQLTTTGTNSVPTGMVRWNSEDGIFVPLSVEVQK
jgi:hypothetical protein